ncbi:LysE family transporter [Sneathiella sp. P13V-1]|uniref:LysE family translocator n=1 Tax=Sneathiella sp. P13V-1 TaxID=2697366 RepID=UPI00187B95CD|nr:LysE family transporter [Sneathiella sp. P13V-1]MBE7637119.1 LysE family transporter [Sneathiella sp. P13V-1]
MDAQVISILLITCLAVISPGPDFAMTLRNSVRYGRTSGLLTALGIACGISVHVTYIVFGLAYILFENTWLLEIMKVIGACYLAWIGILSFFPNRRDGTDVAKGDHSRFFSKIAAIRNGFLSNALNPKTALFFIALFTQIVSPTTSLSAQLSLGLFIALAHLLWFAFVAILLTQNRLETIIRKSKRTIEKVTGACLLGLGLKLLFLSN